MINGDALACMYWGELLLYADMNALMKFTTINEAMVCPFIQTAVSNMFGCQTPLHEAQVQIMFATRTVAAFIEGQMHARQVHSYARQACCAPFGRAAYSNNN